MKKSTKMLFLSLFVLVFGIVVLSSNVILAASENNISLVKTNSTNYMVYVENLNDSFKYAISNSSSTEPTEFEVSSIDSNENNVALIDASTISDTDNVYLWIKTGAEQAVATKVDLNDYIDFSDVTTINNLTKRIPVTNDEQEQTVTDSDNKTKTVVVGITKINDDETKNYEYSLVKLPASDEINDLVALFEKINSFNEETELYTVTTTYKEFIRLYKNIASSITFNVVENMEIKQPEDSITGDRYVMFLRKLDGSDVIDADMQILNCLRKEDNGTNEIVTQKEVQKAVKLPITGDNLVLLAGFVALVVTLIVLLIVKKKSSKKNLQN